MCQMLILKIFTLHDINIEDNLVWKYYIWKHKNIAFFFFFYKNIFIYKYTIVTHTIFPSFQVHLMSYSLV